jgi:hypothetical protein
LVLSVTDDDRAVVAALLAEHGIAEDEFVVCFQLGASEDKKRWTPERFAALAQQLVEQKNARVILLGVREESPLGDAFERAAPGLAIPLFGKTSIPQVGALLERAQLLVTNDTGTMHIAAAVACPMVLVSVGHVHFRETGPYGAGFCAIERRRDALGPADWTPSGPDEGTQPTPDQVLRAISLVLDAKSDPHVQVSKDSDGLSDVDLYVSDFAPDGCLDWYPALRRPLTQADAVRTAYRAMWLEYLREKNEPESERASLARMLDCFDVSEVSLNEWRIGVAEEFTALAELAERGVRTTERLLKSLGRNENLEKAKELVSELSRLNEEIRLYGEVHEPCRPLVLICHYERENLEGSDPVQLARTTLRIYQDLSARARLMPKKLDAVARIASAQSH